MTVLWYSNDVRQRVSCLLPVALRLVLHRENPLPRKSPHRQNASPSPSPRIGLFRVGQSFSEQPAGYVSRRQAGKLVRQNEAEWDRRSTVIRLTTATAKRLTDMSSTMGAVVIERAAQGSRKYGALVEEWAPRREKHEQDSRTRRSAA